MPLKFNDLLSDGDISPSDVRLLKHHTERRGRLTPYELWRDRPSDFEQGYQRTQDPEARTHFGSKYWASFVCPERGETLFVGLFRISNRRPVPQDWRDPISGERPGVEKNRTYDLYDCQPVNALARFRGNLRIEWGESREWRQRADLQNKIVLQFAERDPLLDQLKTQAGVLQIELDQLRTTPERKQRLSRYIERGPVGALVKTAREGRCQLCECLGRTPVSFMTRDGTPYAEAHHVFPVSKGGSLGAGNIMVLCPNHHREVHHGDFEILQYRKESWRVRLVTQELTIPRTLI
jgi:hypothetical protein